MRTTVKLAFLLAFTALGYGGWLALLLFLFLGWPGVVASMGVVVVLLVYYWIMAPRAFLKAAEVRPVPEGPLRNMVRHLARKSGLPMPALYLSPWREPNAFAVGTGRRTAVVITRGLLDSLDEREGKAVLAHELGHLRHRDLEWKQLEMALIRAGDWGARGFRTLAWFLTGVSETLSCWSYIFRLPAWVFRLGAYLVQILHRITVGLVDWAVMAASREREFRADAWARELGCGPDLAAALTRMDQEGATPRRAAWVVRLYASHPATQERIRVLLGNRGIVSESDTMRS